MKERYKLLRSDPGLYYRNNIDSIDISPEGDIEEMIALLMAGLSIYNGDFFVRLSNIILNHRDFSNSPEYQFYYHLSRFSYFRYIQEMNYALESIQKAYKLSLILDDTFYIVKALGQLATLYSILQDYETSFFYLEQALEYGETLEDKILFADTYNSLGLLMFHQKRFEDALKAFTRALDLYEKEKEKERHLNFVILLLNTGETLMELGENTEAETFFSSGIRIAEERDFVDYFGQLILLIAEVFFRRKEFDKSYNYMKRFISQSDRFREDRNRVHKIHDRDKLKEEIMTLNTLRQRNEELNNRLNNLYDRLDSRDREELHAGALFEEISKAMNDGELHSWFQPQWSLKEKRYIGAEALIRWIKPDGSIFKPDTFIDIIEESNLIHKLTKIVVSQAFSFCRYMRDHIDPHFIVSINISPYELHHFDVLTLIEKEMLLKGLYPENVEIEITERTFLDRNPLSVNKLYQLKEMGIRIALDDFGTGYSSLSCLNRIPFDRVKVDRSLLLNATAMGKGDRMLESIIRLLHDLEYPVVVEGVEKEDHLELVKKLGADEVQGFLFSKAVPQESFLRLF
ncbi:EAL domain-containing protein [Spirochaeta isovalerica]|nr:EAL domain-containing protein [Spirochaeta isovalerica]